MRTRIAEHALIGSHVPAAEAEPNRRLFEALLTYPPEKAAERILRAVERRRARLLIAANAKVPDLLARVAPAGHARLLGALTSAAVSLSRRSLVRPPEPGSATEAGLSR